MCLFVSVHYQSPLDMPASLEDECLILSLSIGSLNRQGKGLSQKVNLFFLSLPKTHGLSKSHFKPRSLPTLAQSSVLYPPAPLWPPSNLCHFFPQPTVMHQTQQPISTTHPSNGYVLGPTYRKRTKSKEGHFPFAWWQSWLIACDQWTPVSFPDVSLSLFFFFIPWGFPRTLFREGRGRVTPVAFWRSHGWPDSDRWWVCEMIKRHKPALCK